MFSTVISYNNTPSSQDGKGTQCRGEGGGGIWASLFLGDINTGIWPSRRGVSRVGTIKYGLESRGTQTQAGLCWQDQQQQ
jgi:hypothetical protein